MMRRAGYVIVLLIAVHASAGSIDVHLVSWNLHGLFWPIAPHTPTRLRIAAEKVLALEPDVVMFEEVWFRRYAEVLKTEFVARRYQSIDYHHRGPIRTGGLLVFIKEGWTIDKIEFVKYSSVAPWWYVYELDGLSGKGFLAVDVTAPGGEHLTFIDTHLQSQYGNPNKPEAKHNWLKIRDSELAQLDGYGQAHSATTIILAGDFNTMPDEPIMRNFKLSWGELTEYARMSCAKPCGTHWDKKTKCLPMNGSTMCSFVLHTVLRRTFSSFRTRRSTALTRITKAWTRI